MIETHSLKKHFIIPEGEIKAVDGITVKIDKGEFIAVMGPSGSGKSTLLYVLGAMDRPTEGWIEVAGNRLDRMSDYECSRFRNRELGFVFQSFHLLTRIDIARNVELPMTYAGVPLLKRKARAESLLKALGLGEKLKRYPPELSGGQSQRAAIARALVNGPKLLLADEPTGNLDSRTGLEVMAIFQGLNSRGMTVLMVTHDETMAQHAKRILRMRDGLLVSDEKVPGQIKSPLPPGMDLSILDSPI